MHDGDCVTAPAVVMLARGNVKALSVSATTNRGKCFMDISLCSSSQVDDGEISERPLLTSRAVFTSPRGRRPGFMGFSRRPLTVAGQRRNFTYFAATRLLDLIPRMWGGLALSETSEDATFFDFGYLT